MTSYSTVTSYSTARDHGIRDKIKPTGQLRTLAAARAVCGHARQAGAKHFFRGLIPVSCLYSVLTVNKEPLSPKCDSAQNTV